MQWILHIGTQKTGSKAIQNTLASNPDWLDKNNMIYPTHGRESIWHQPIFHALKEGHTEFLEAVKQEKYHSTAAHGILSCELFYTLTKENIIKIREILGDSLIILFIRRQDLLLNSLLNQMVKAHRQSYSDICLFEESIDRFNLDQDYWSTLKKWANVFGFENVKPIIYSKEVNSVEAFFQAIDVFETLPKMDNANPNPALNQGGIEILKIVKRLCGTKDLIQLVDAAHSLLKDHFVDTYSNGEHLILEFEKRHEIVSRYSASNAKLKEKYFKNSHSLFTPLKAQINNTDQKLDSHQIKKITTEIFRNAGVDIPSEEKLEHAIKSERACLL